MASPTLKILASCWSIEPFCTAKTPEPAKLLAMNPPPFDVNVEVESIFISPP